MVGLMRFRLLILAALASSAWAGGSGWQKDFDQALKKAKKADKPLLVEFTEGEASKALNKKIFYTAKFESWAKKRVILVEINYSKKVSSKLAKQYADVKAKFKIEKFPTVMLIDGEGKSIGTLAFSDRTDPQAWMTEADEIVETASGAGAWITDWAKAKKMSKRTKKPMLVDFNGSDW